MANLAEIQRILAKIENSKSKQPTKYEKYRSNNPVNAALEDVWRAEQALEDARQRLLNLAADQAECWLKSQGK